MNCLLGPAQCFETLLVGLGLLGCEQTQLEFIFFTCCAVLAVHMAAIIQMHNYFDIKD